MVDFVIGSDKLVLNGDELAGCALEDDSNLKANLNTFHFMLDELYSKSPFFKDMVDNYDSIDGDIKEMVFFNIMDDLWEAYK